MLNLIQNLRRKYFIWKTCAAVQKNISRDRQYIYDLLLYLHVIESYDGLLDSDGMQWVDEMKYIIQDNLNRLNQLSEAVDERDLPRINVLNSALQHSSARLFEKVRTYVDLFEGIISEG